MLLLCSKTLWTDVSSKLNTVATENLTKFGLTTNFGYHPRNLEKNRYHDCLPFDHNRVKVTPTETNETGYINASLIKFPIVDRKYIMAGEPPVSGREQFWRMIVEQQVPCIVRLSAYNKKEEAQPNYPEKLNQVLCVGEYKIECTKIIPDGFCQIRELKVTNCSKTHYLKHYLVTNWSQKKMFPEEETWCSFLKQVVDTVTKNKMGWIYKTYLFIKSFFVNVPSFAPIIQCSNGFARSGAFIICDVMTTMIRENVLDHYCIEDMLTQLRMQRANVWQPTKMTKFIYQFLLHYLMKTNDQCAGEENLLLKHLESVPDSWRNASAENFVNPKKWMIDEYDRDVFICTEKEKLNKAKLKKEGVTYRTRFPHNDSRRFMREHLKRI
ncbi:unnamed protein product [Caenorhabditis brenneri]